MHDWSKYKIGIVLSGGGAKGAYEIGCWKALLQEGIRFTAIAGTSIGGINGYLMSLGDFNGAQDVWIKMGRKSPLRFSLFRLFLVFLERLGLAFMMGFEIVVLLPLVAFFALIVIVLVSIVAYWIAPQVLYPLGTVISPLVPFTLLAFARLFRGTGIAQITREGIRYSFRQSRRHARQLSPVEFTLVFGFAIGAVIPVGMLLYSIINFGHSWAWSLLLLPCLLLDLLAILFSSDAGFSSPGEISLLSTEDLEELLVDHGAKNVVMPAHPHLYLARMREENVTLPGSIPKEVIEVMRTIAPNKRREDLTTQDLDHFRLQLDRSELNSYFTNSTEVVLGLEYVKLSGRPVLEAADSVLATSAIADVLGRVQERLSGVAEEDVYLRGMRAEFYDPGLVDNTPIAPLLEAEECNLIVVIFLDHEIKDPTQYLEQHLNQINAKIRRLNPDLDDQTYDTLRKVSFLKPIQSAPSKLRNVKLIPVIPSQELGRGALGFIRETITFREPRIRELMRLGFEDTQRAINQFLELQVEN